MLYIGSHVGFNKDSQLLGSLNEALEYGANTFMFYTGAPQNTKRYDIDDNLTINAINEMNDKGIDINKIIVHAPYIINLANRIDDDKYNFSINFLIQELERCNKLHIKNIVLHPGSHVGQGIDVGLKNIIDALNKVFEKNKDDVNILIETMAGKGTEVGSNFDEIKKIIDGVSNKDRIGVCLDTCHLNDSGYDLSNFDELLDDFDKKIGLEYIKCVHINDSKNIIGSRKDRHENIGNGFIGLDKIMNVVNNERLNNIPMILETPYINDLPPYKEEIALIRKYNK